MERITLFYLLCTIGAILLIAVVYIASSMKHILRSKNLRANENGASQGHGPLMSVMLILLSIIPAGLSAQDLAAADAQPFIPNDTLLWALGIMDLTLFAVVLYIKSLLNTVLMMDPKFAAFAAKKEALKAKTAKKIDIIKILQDSVDIEDEDSILTDHEYDGIRELDNNLPPWWKYGFYLSIVFAGVYLTIFHVLGAAPLQIEEYEASVKAGQEEVQAYLASQSMNVDETNVVILTDADALAEGKATFTQYCVACHREDGGGSVGPNMTDQYWIHGGDVKNLFTVVKYGANNGMKSWKDELNPIQMQNVVSYILTLQGTNPVDPKEPQGELYIPIEVPSDSTAVEASAPEGEITL